MKKRNAIRIISFLSAAVLVIGGFYFKSMRKNEKFKLQIENAYSRSLNDLTASVNNISLALEKARYINEAEHLGEVSVKLLCESEICKNALSQLPAGSQLDVLNRFLSQVGNYALAVSGEVYSNKEFPKEYGDNITALSDTAKKVSKAVNDAQINYNNSDYWAKELEEKLDGEIEKSLSVSFTDLEGELTDYPTLVYDGPYSDHILKKEPLMVKEGETLTRTQAENIAEEFSTAKLEFVAEENGRIPVFRFSGNDTDITVSKTGGYVVYMRKPRTFQDYVLNYELPLSKARRFLDKNNLSSFKETYYFTDEGVCVINFAFLDGQTVCYTDLIKVGVAMDSGEIVFFESSGYLGNHKERAFETPVYTQEDAKLVISPKLTIQKISLALIPTESDEVRCYEFVCNDNGQEVLVYINVMTLKEEDILILLKSDGGILAK